MTLSPCLLLELQLKKICQALEKYANAKNKQDLFKF